MTKCPYDQHLEKLRYNRNCNDKTSNTTLIFIPITDKDFHRSTLPCIPVSSGKVTWKMELATSERRAVLLNCVSTKMNQTNTMQ